MATIQDIVESRLQDAQTKLAADAARRTEAEPMPPVGDAPPDEVAAPAEGVVAAPAEAPPAASEGKTAEDLYVNTDDLRSMALSLGDVGVESDAEKEASSVAVAAAMLDEAEEEKEGFVTKKTMNAALDAAAQVGAEEGRRAGMRTGLATGLGASGLGVGAYALHKKTKERPQGAQPGYQLPVRGGYGGYGKYAAEEEKEARWTPREKAIAAGSAAVGASAVGLGQYSAHRQGERKGRTAERAQVADRVAEAYRAGIERGSQARENLKQASWFKYTGPKLVSQDKFDKTVDAARKKGRTEGVGKEEFDEAVESARQQGRQEVEAEQVAQGKKILATGGAATALAAGGTYGGYRYGERKGVRSEQAKDPYQIRSAYTMGAQRGYTLGSQKVAAGASDAAKQVTKVLGDWDEAFRSGRQLGKAEGRTQGFEEASGEWSRKRQEGFQQGTEQAEARAAEDAAKLSDRNKRLAAGGAVGAVALAAGTGYGGYRYGQQKVAAPAKQVMDEAVEAARKQGIELGDERGFHRGYQEARVAAKERAENLSRKNKRLAAGAAAGGTVVAGGGAYGAYRYGERQGVRSEQAKDPRQMAAAYMMGARRGYNLGSQKVASSLMRRGGRSVRQNLGNDLYSRGRQDGALKGEREIEEKWSLKAKAEREAGHDDGFASGRERGVNEERRRGERASATARSEGEETGYQRGHGEGASKARSEAAAAAEETSRRFKRQMTGFGLGAAALTAGGTYGGYRRGQNKEAAAQAFRRTLGKSERATLRGNYDQGHRLGYQDGKSRARQEWRKKTDAEFEAGHDEGFAAGREEGIRTQRANNPDSAAARAEGDAAGYQRGHEEGTGEARAEGVMAANKMSDRHDRWRAGVTLGGAALAGGGTYAGYRYGQRKQAAAKAKKLMDADDLVAKAKAHGREDGYAEGKAKGIRDSDAEHEAELGERKKKFDERGYASGRESGKTMAASNSRMAEIRRQYWGIGGGLGATALAAGGAYGGYRRGQKKEAGAAAKAFRKTLSEADRKTYDEAYNNEHVFGKSHGGLDGYWGQNSKNREKTFKEEDASWDAGQERGHAEEVAAGQKSDKRKGRIFAGVMAGGGAALVGGATYAGNRLGQRRRPEAQKEARWEQARASLGEVLDKVRRNKMLVGGGAAAAAALAAGGTYGGYRYGERQGIRSEQAKDPRQMAAAYMMGARRGYTLGSQKQASVSGKQIPKYVRRTFEEGFSEGRGKGIQEGMLDGVETGIREGRVEGRRAGDAEGFARGRTEGDAAGFDRGQREATEAANARAAETSKRNRRIAIGAGVGGAAVAGGGAYGAYRYGQRKQAEAQKEALRVPLSARERDLMLAGGVAAGGGGAIAYQRGRKKGLARRQIHSAYRQGHGRGYGLGFPHGQRLRQQRLQSQKQAEERKEARVPWTGREKAIAAGSAILGTGAIAGAYHGGKRRKATKDQLRKAYLIGGHRGYLSGGTAGYRSGQGRPAAGQKQAALVTKVRRTFDDGLIEGWDRGVRHGIGKGHGEGIETGVRIGRRQGDRAGFERGRTEGRAEGDAAGFDRGQREGDAAGFGRGHQEATEAANVRAAETAQRTRRIAIGAGLGGLAVAGGGAYGAYRYGQRKQASIPGVQIPKYVRRTFEEGLEKGHDKGFLKGVGVGEKSGFNKGQWAAQSDGHDRGYREAVEDTERKVEDVERRTKQEVEDAARRTRRIATGMGVGGAAVAAGGTYAGYRYGQDKKASWFKLTGPKITMPKLQLTGPKITAPKADYTSGKVVPPKAEYTGPRIMHPEKVEADLAAARRDSDAIGFTRGRAEGESTGFTRGRAESDRAGFERGRTEGMESGTRQGTLSGRRRGYKKGRSDGSRAGFNRGRQVGDEAGFTRGRAEGDAAGFTRGRAEGESTGFTRGRTEGDRAGFERGQREGDAAGFTRGRAEGDTAGFGRGQQEATEAANARAAETAQRTRRIAGGAGLGGLAVAGAGAYGAHRHGERKGIRSEQAKDPYQIRSAYMMGARRGYSLGNQKQAGLVAGGLEGLAQVGKKIKPIDFSKARLNRVDRTIFDAQQTRTDGRTQGFDEGWFQGRGFGDEEGFSRGHRSGLAEGTRKGRAESRSFFERGQREGDAAGFARGRAEGDEAGFGRGRQEGYASGFERGRAESDEAGFNRGRTEGDRTGFERGQREGDARGFERGRNEGDRTGFERGQREGDRAGFERGHFNATEAANVRAAETTNRYKRMAAGGAAGALALGGGGAYGAYRYGQNKKASATSKVDDVLATHIKNAIREQVRQKMKGDLVDQIPAFVAGMGAPAAAGLGYAVAS